MEKSREIGITVHELNVLAESANCLFYRATIQENGNISIVWTAGKIGETKAFPLQDLIDGRLQPIYAAKTSRHIDRLRMGRSSEITITYRGLDGQPVKVRDMAHGMRGHDGVTTIMGTVTAQHASISERETRAGNWIEEIIESVDQGIAYWTNERKLVYANRNFQAFLGDPAEETLDGFLRGLAVCAKFVTSEEPGEWVARNFRDLDAQMSSIWTRNDGRSYQVSWRTLPSGIMMLLHDITKVRTSERTLQEARDLAEEANANKSRFLRAANHDLRQPLATLKILMFSEMENKGSGDHSDVFAAMEVAVSIMEDILESLLQIGQLDANKISVEKQHFQASYMLERMRLQFEPQAKSKGIAFHVVSSVVTLESDRILLERILSNIIANAIKFTTSGGVLLGLRRKGRFVEIQVVDSGSGIPDDQIEFIFQEFYQGEIDVADRRRGLGLGLNIAARLSNLLNHPLRVKSSLGKGTVFSVTVPIGDIWRSKIDHFDIDERIAGEFMGVKVILIEDDANLREAISVMLTRWGVRVLSVKDGTQALEVMDTNDFVPELAIVDYSLPNNELGTNAIALIREKIRQPVPGIVCTAEVGRDVVASIKAQGLPVLTKPVNPARLRSVMHHLLYERDQLHQATSADT